jgi:glucokinase
VLFDMRSRGDISLPVVAIDLGGSKIALGIVSREYRVLTRADQPTLAEEGVESVISRLISAVKQLVASGSLAMSRLCGISVAAAGAIDSPRGIVTLSPNLPGWRDIPLASIVEERLGIRTWLLNDANGAALGEHHLGVGRGVDNLIYLGIGTGIGGAIIIDGKLYTGACGSAGEIGHMTIEVNEPRCECGNSGCLEQLAAGKAIARQAKERLNSGERSSLTDAVAGRVENITAKDVAVAAREGDFLAGDVINNAATYLGVGMVSLVNIFNPEMIIVGGGVANMGDLLLAPVRQMVKERAFPESAAVVRIVNAELGSDAGLLGAAHFAFMQNRNREEKS